MTTEHFKSQRGAVRCIAALDDFSCWIAKFMACLAGIFLVALFFLVCANIAGRALGLNIRGAVECSGLLAAVAGSMSLGFAQIRHNHIAGGVMEHGLSGSVRFALGLLAYAAGAVFFAAAAFELFDLGIFALESGEEVEGAGKFYPYLALLTVPGFMGQSLVLLCLFVTSLLRGREG